MAETSPASIAPDKARRAGIVGEAVDRQAHDCAERRDIVEEPLASPLIVAEHGE
jgi:hypothetical protein